MKLKILLEKLLIKSCDRANHEATLREWENVTGKWSIGQHAFSVDLSSHHSFSKQIFDTLVAEVGEDLASFFFFHANQHNLSEIVIPYLSSILLDQTDGLVPEESGSERKVVIKKGKKPNEATYSCSSIIREKSTNTGSVAYDSYIRFTLAITISYENGEYVFKQPQVRSKSKGRLKRLFTNDVAEKTASEFLQKGKETIDDDSFVKQAKGIVKKAEEEKKVEIGKRVVERVKNNSDAAFEEFWRENGPLHQFLDGGFEIGNYWKSSKNKELPSIGHRAEAQSNQENGDEEDRKLYSAYAKIAEGYEKELSEGNVSDLHILGWNYGDLLAQQKQKEGDGFDSNMTPYLVYKSAWDLFSKIENPTAGQKKIIDAYASIAEMSKLHEGVENIAQLAGNTEGGMSFEDSLKLRRRSLLEVVESESYDSSLGPDQDVRAVKQALQVCASRELLILEVYFLENRYTQLKAEISDRKALVKVGDDIDQINQKLSNGINWGNEKVVRELVIKADASLLQMAAQDKGMPLSKYCKLYKDGILDRHFTTMVKSEVSSKDWRKMRGDVYTEDLPTNIALAFISGKVSEASRMMVTGRYGFFPSNLKKLFSGYNNLSSKQVIAILEKAEHCEEAVERLLNNKSKKRRFGKNQYYWENFKLDDFFNLLRIKSTFIDHVISKNAGLQNKLVAVFNQLLANTESIDHEGRMRIEAFIYHPVVCGILSEESKEDLAKAKNLLDYKATEERIKSSMDEITSGQEILTSNPTEMSIVPQASKQNADRFFSRLSRGLAFGRQLQVAPEVRSMLNSLSNLRWGVHDEVYTARNVLFGGQPFNLQLIFGEGGRVNLKGIAQQSGIANDQALVVDGNPMHSFEVNLHIVGGNLTVERMVTTSDSSSSYTRIMSSPVGSSDSTTPVVFDAQEEQGLAQERPVELPVPAAAATTRIPDLSVQQEIIVGSPS